MTPTFRLIVTALTLLVWPDIGSPTEASRSNESESVTAVVAATAAGDGSSTTTAVQAVQSTPNLSSSVTVDQAQGSADTPATDRVETLITATRDPKWKNRWDAVNELGNLKDPRGISALVERALHDENPHPRWRSLWALSSINPKGTDAVGPLGEALNSTNPTVVHNAAVALAFFKDPTGRTTLLKSINDEREFWRWEAIFSLRRIADSETVDAVRARLDATRESSVKVRSEAALALGRMGRWEVVPALLQALRKDPSVEVRWRAAMSLSTVGDPCLMPELRELQGSETEAAVQQQLEKTLNKLEKLTARKACATAAE